MTPLAWIATIFAGATALLALISGESGLTLIALGLTVIFYALTILTIVTQVRDTPTEA
jgi:hypothetical protein